MQEYCENGCGAIPQSQVETTVKAFNRKLCPKCSLLEGEKSADELVPVRVRVRRKLEQEGFEQHEKKPGLFIKGESPHMRFVDIARLPVSVEIGLLRADGERVTEGHGIIELEGLQQEIDAILKSSKKAPRERHENKATEEKKTKDQISGKLEVTSTGTSTDQRCRFLKRITVNTGNYENVALEVSECNSFEECDMLLAAELAVIGQWHSAVTKREART